MTVRANADTAAGWLRDLGGSHCREDFGTHPHTSARKTSS